MTKYDASQGNPNRDPNKPNPSQDPNKDPNKKPGSDKPYGSNKDRQAK